MNQQKGFANIILIVVIVALVGVVGYFAFVKKSEPIAQQPTPTPTQTTISTKTPPPTPTPIATEKASGIIKSVYSNSGKNYIDIDYIELNPNWTPGGMSGPAYQNSNSKIRTFEISPSAKFVVGSPATDSVTFSEFQNFFSPSSTSYQKLNLWDIVIVDGVVTKITEHFLP